MGGVSEAIVGSQYYPQVCSDCLSHNCYEREAADSPNTNNLTVKQM